MEMICGNCRSTKSEVGWIVDRTDSQTAIIACQVLCWQALGGGQKLLSENTLDRIPPENHLLEVLRQTLESPNGGNGRILNLDEEKFFALINFLSDPQLPEEPLVVKKPEANKILVWFDRERKCFVRICEGPECNNEILSPLSALHQSCIITDRQGVHFTCSPECQKAFEEQSAAKERNNLEESRVSDWSCPGNGVCGKV